MLTKSIALLSVLIALLSSTARAEDEVLGFVKIVTGEASVITAGTVLPAQPGTPVHRGNILKTGENASLGITFKDNTIISLGPDTEITIDEYLYAPAKGELKLFASLLHGTLHYISGVIAKLKPEAVQVKTPAGVIGVRGTRFLAKAEAK